MCQTNWGKILYLWGKKIFYLKCYLQNSWFFSPYSVLLYSQCPRLSSLWPWWSFWVTHLLSLPPLSFKNSSHQPNWEEPIGLRKYRIFFHFCILASFLYPIWKYKDSRDSKAWLCRLAMQTTIHQMAQLAKCLMSVI